MTLARRVIWKEGMFLRAHHFQQQDRRVESLLAARAAALEPFSWGFTDLEIDRGLLEAGQVGLTRAAGAFADGALFDAPGEAAEIAPIRPGPEAAGALVWLAVPALALGAPLAAAAPGAARYAVRPEDLANQLDPGAAPQTLELGRIGLRLSAGPRPEGFDALPIARIAEVGAGRVRLDPEYIPPLLSIAASARALGQLAEVAARLGVRADQIAGPGGSAGAASAGGVQQLLLLQLCNGKAARLGHLSATGTCHPERLYTELVETAAELAAYGRDARRAPALPAYDHDDLTLCLGAAFEAILAALGQLEDPAARPIPLDYHEKNRLHYNRAIDPTLVENARLFLVASSNMTEDQLRSAFPSNVYVGSTGQIGQIMGAAASSVAVIPRAHFPPEIRPLSGYVCFELDLKSPAYAAVRQERTIAIHSQRALDPLDLQLWAIRD